MSFISPWQSVYFRGAVALSRWLLQPFANLETRLVEKLTSDQNLRVLEYLKNHPPQNMLLILPRCVKKSGCRAQVQNGLDECLPCGQCPLGQVAQLCNHYDLEALVAFRSHIAFEIARKRNPDLIIASACHDRLIKALRTVPEYPALLAALPPMEKMCVNADLDLVWLEKQLAMVSPCIVQAKAAGGA